MTAGADQKGKKLRHAPVVLPLLLLVAGMTGLSFAAAPLYRLFCEATGYGGTTQRAASAPAEVSEKTVTVHFDANVSSGLGWDFRPEQRAMTLKIGENSLAFYRATNATGAPLTGTATFNVTPEIAGGYFNKIECFCFTEQRLEPGQSAEFPVSFFIDPAILADPDARHIGEITLSYTFFKAKTSGSAAAPADGNAASLEKARPSG